MMNHNADGEGPRADVLGGFDRGPGFSLAPILRVGECAGRMALTSPALLLLFLMLVFPMAVDLLYVKAALFAGCLLVVCARILATGRLRLHPLILLFSLLMTTSSLLFSLRGLSAGAPGAMKQAQVYGFWPVVYTLLADGAANRRVLLTLSKVMAWATLAIGLYGTWFVLSTLGILPHHPLIDLLSFGSDVGIGLYAGYIEITFPGLNSLPFLVPFVMTGIVAFPSTGRSGRTSFLLHWAALIAGMTVVLISGRRALLIVVAAAPVLISLLRLRQRDSERSENRSRLIGLFAGSALVVGGALVYLSIYHELNVLSIAKMVVQGFQFADPTNVDAAARREQYVALLAGWTQNPILGAGHGASVPGSIRAPDMPWAYELQYVALLYQIGIVGLCIYGMGVLWIYWMSLRLIREGGPVGQMALCSLVGLSCYLVATATNPYMARFDGLWAVFVPIFLVNLRLLESRRLSERLRPAPAHN